MKRLTEYFGEPSVLRIGTVPALLCAFKKLQINEFDAFLKHCTIKYCNQLIKQNHRYVKRCFVKLTGFQNLQTNFAFSISNAL